MDVERLFSNESGMGSAPIVAAAAQTKNPVRQALVSSTGTFGIRWLFVHSQVWYVNTEFWNSGLQGIQITQKRLNQYLILGLCF
jgi:AGCS family alanine or glycine:cation symporter